MLVPLLSQGNSFNHITASNRIPVSAEPDLKHKPWVRTELMNSQEAEQAMPLEQFISEAMKVLGTEADEIIVEAAKPLRNNPGPGEHALVNGFNAQMLSLFAAQPSPAGQRGHG